VYAKNSFALSCQGHGTRIYERRMLVFLVAREEQMHRTFMAIAVGATLALVFNKTIAGLLNTVLSPLGLTYA
jgi:hypothetical protein